MTTTVWPIKTKKINQSLTQNQKIVAALLEIAADMHLEATMYHEAANHEKASQSTMKAHVYQDLAIEAQKEYGKHHALKN